MSKKQLPDAAVLILVVCSICFPSQIYIMQLKLPCVSVPSAGPRSMISVPREVNLEQTDNALTLQHVNLNSPPSIKLPVPIAVSWGVDFIGFNISITTAEIIVLCAARHILTSDPFTSQLNRKQREGMTARLDLPYPGFSCNKSCNHSMHCHWMCDVAGALTIPVLVGDLLPGQRYSCSVSAENKNGLSLSSPLTITSTTDLCRGLSASPSGSVVHIMYAVDKNSLTMFAASAMSLLQSAKCQNMLLKLHVTLIDIDLSDFNVLFNVSFAHVT